MLNLKDSCLYRISSEIYDGLKGQIVNCLGTSFLVKYSTKLASGLYCLSARSIGVIILILVVSNIILYNILRCFEDVEIGLFGWIVRGILLFVGFAGIFCKARLKDLRETSLFVRWIDRIKLSLSEEK